MPQEVNWSTIVSFLSGGGFAAFCVNLFIKRAVDQLDKFTKKMESMSDKVLVMENDLEELNKLRDMVSAHDRKIVELDVRSMKTRSMVRNKN